MRKLFYCILITTTVFSSCKKGTVNPDNIVICYLQPIDTLNIPDGCISRLYLEPTKTKLTAADFSKSTQLFQQNNISTSTLHFFRYTFDACPTCVTPGPYETVRADQFFNGQLLFNGDVLYSFRQGTFSFTNGHQFNSIALDTVATTRLQVLRKLFVNLLNNDGWQISRAFKDSCMVAQFGYYDVNAGSGTQPVGNFVKAWKITPKNHEYPVAYFIDDRSNSLLYYFNGIMTGL